MKKFMIILVCFLVLSPLESQAFRCKNKLVSEGDTKYDVLMKCGEPTQKDMEQITRWTYIGYQFIIVEIWLYNLGPRRLIQIIEFQSNRVVNIRTGGYGYRKNRN